jgi:stage II sporulation protein D
MRDRRRLLFVVAWVVGLLTVVVPAAPGQAPSSAPTGWAVERVRFEPLDGRGSLDVSGVGSYRGAIEVTRAGAGLAVVNDVGFEDYVRGISEVPVRWPLEAQRAQAIAARTYALATLLDDTATEARGAGADICATQSCQVYTGLEKERRPGGGAWLAAVESTAGQVLLYRGKPIVAKYSSTNGGRTVAGGRPYLRSIPDPDDAVSPYHRWQVTLPLSTLTSLFTPPGDVTAATRSGDTVVLGWQAADGSSGGLLVPAADFRARVNAAVPTPGGLPLTLPSVRFDLASDGASAIVDGRGWGHGVGMSQYGALGKALRGMKASDILATYYAGLRPVAVPAEQLPRTIRVAVAVGQPAAAVTGPARFRVLDGDGRVLALGSSGGWRVVPGPGRQVRVVPPPADAGPPAVEVVSVEPSLAPPGTPVQLRFRLSVPAAVRLTVQPPAAAPVTVDAGVRDAGIHELTLPPAPVAGDGVATIWAEAGVDRAASVPVAYRIGVPPRPGPARAAATAKLDVADEPGLLASSLVALVLLVGVGALLVRVRGQVQ